ncbi:hypothetical protein ALC53_11871, partial [Atta colombica]
RILNEILYDDVNYLYLIILKSVFYELNKICVIAKKILKLLFVENINNIIKNDTELAYVESNETDFEIEYYKYYRKIKASVSKSVIKNVEQQIII